MRGRLSLDAWAIEQQGDGFYVAQRIKDKKLETEYISAHCLACAKTDILLEFAGRVDIRGWHKQGICGAFLREMQNIVNEEVNDERKSS